MKKKIHEAEEQLNKHVPVVEQEESYNLEDIMREFGGWTSREDPEDIELLWTPREKPAGEKSAEEKPPLVVKKQPRMAAEPDEKPDVKPEVKQDEAPKAQKKPPVQPEEEPKKKPAQSDVMRVVAEGAEKPKPSIKLIDLSGDTIAFQAVREENLEEPEEKSTEPVEMPEEPAPDPKQERAERRAQRRSDQRLKKLERQRRKAQKAALRAARREEPEVVYPSPADACAAYAKVGTLRLRILLSALLTLASAGLLLLSEFSLGGLDLTGQLRLLSVMMVALALGQCVLSYEVFIRGIYQALKLRFDLMSLVTLTVLLSLADGFFAISQGRVPFCAVTAVALLLALWSVALEKRAKWRTLKTVLSMEEPMAAVKQEKAWHGLDCVFRREGSLEDFTAMLETPDAAQKVMRIYAPVAAAASFAFAVLAAYRTDGSFLWSWTAILTAALPGGGLIACCRPFSILAKRLHGIGAAVCGWRGAKILSGECGIAIEDKDLFPEKNISMNGMKMYSELPVRQVVGYATAVVQAAGSGLLPLFEEVMKNEDGRRYTADSFRQYEGGGLGAEIRGDVVLMGSLPFMRLMGVAVPEGIRVQSAVYLSVNKELAGVFALSYQPSAGTRSGLGYVLRSKGLTPILATRDFMITPALVKKRYKLSVDRFEFPIVAERVALSDPQTAEGRQGALMSRDHFLSFAGAVAGSRLLRRTVHGAVAVSLLGGIFGLMLMAVLTYVGAVQALSALNLLLYTLLWLLPTLLITGLVGKT